VGLSSGPEPPIIIWRRFGKEHGEDAFRLNDSDTVLRHLTTKAEGARETTADPWPWYHVSDQLLMERVTNAAGGTAGLLSYLPERECLIEDRWDDAGESHEWCIHLGSTEYDEALSSWVFTDWFVDIIWSPSSGRYRVVDLDDLADVHQLGVVDDLLLHHILQSSQALLDSLENAFPPVELTKMSALMRQIGWL
jgi:hypothetical protein